MYIHFRNPVTILCFCLATLPAFAQGVDPLTGRAIISVPLGSVSALDLSVSLGLSHHGGALKVNEGPGNAGMGWSASLGSGYVSREVRGLPDEFNYAGDNRKGWLYTGQAQSIQTLALTAGNDLSQCYNSDWAIIDAQLNNSLGYVFDTEPDIFYFQAPGISGKFVFGTDGLPKLIPYQDLQITVAGSFSGLPSKRTPGWFIISRIRKM